MTLEELSQKAIEVRDAYAQLNTAQGHQPWTHTERLQGFIGDVGDLTKLIMAKNNFRNTDNVDEKLAHELADCLWSILILAKELNINLEEAFTKTMQELTEGINKKLK